MGGALRGEKKKRRSVAVREEGRTLTGGDAKADQELCCVFTDVPGVGRSINLWGAFGGGTRGSPHRGSATRRGAINQGEFI